MRLERLPRLRPGRGRTVAAGVRHRGRQARRPPLRGRAGGQRARARREHRRGGDDPCRAGDGRPAAGAARWRPRRAEARRRARRRPLRPRRARAGAGRRAAGGADRDQAADRPDDRGRGELDAVARHRRIAAGGALDGEPRARCRSRALSPVGDAGAGAVPQGAAAAADGAAHPRRRRGNACRADPRWAADLVVARAARGGAGRNRPWRAGVAQDERWGRRAATRHAGRADDGARHAAAVDARRPLRARRLRLSGDRAERCARRQDGVRERARRRAWAARAVALARAAAAARGGGDRGGRRRGRHPAQHQPAGDAGGDAQADPRRPAGAAQRQAQCQRLAADRPHHRALRHLGRGRAPALPHPQSWRRRCRDAAARRARAGRQGVARRRHRDGDGATARQCVLRKPDRGAAAGHDRPRAGFGRHPAADQFAIILAQAAAVGGRDAAPRRQLADRGERAAGAIWRAQAAARRADRAARGRTDAGRAQ